MLDWLLPLMGSTLGAYIASEALKATPNPGAVALATLLGGIFGSIVDAILES